MFRQLHLVRDTVSHVNGSRGPDRFQVLADMQKPLSVTFYTNCKRYTATLV